MTNAKSVVSFFTTEAIAPIFDAFIASFISVIEYAGSILINCEKGNIELNDIVGGIEAITSSGDINLDLSYDSSIKDYSIYVETHSGNITANIPKSLPANMKNIVYQTRSAKAINSEINQNYVKI